MRRSVSGPRRSFFRRWDRPRPRDWAAAAAAEGGIAAAAHPPGPPAGLSARRPGLWPCSNPHLLLRLPRIRPEARSPPPQLLPRRPPTRLPARPGASVIATRRPTVRPVQPRKTDAGVVTVLVAQ